MNKQTLNVCILSLFTLACGQITAHDSQVDEKPSTTNCLLEAPVNENSTPELPTHVLEFLCAQLGFARPATTKEDGNPIAGRPLTGLTGLPPEVMTSVCRCNPKSILKIVQRLGFLELMSLTGPDGNPLTYTELKFSPHETYIAAKDQDDHYHLFDSKGRFIRTLAGPDGIPLTCKSITFSPHRTFIAANGTNNHCHLFDCLGNFVRTLNGPDGNPLEFIEVRFSPHETYIAANDTNRDFHLFDCQGNLRTLTGSNGTPLICSNLKFSPHETYIGAGDTNNHIHLFDDQGNFVRTLTSSDDTSLTGYNIKFSPYETFIATEDQDDQCHLFDSQGNFTRTLTSSDGTSLTCTRIDFSPHETFIAAWDTNNHIHLFDSQGNFVRTLTSSDDTSLTCCDIIFSPQETYIAAVDTNSHCHLFDCQGNVFRTLTGSNGTPLTCSNLRLSPHETYIAANDKNSHWKLFDCQGNFVRTLNGSNDTLLICSNLKFSPHETYIATDDKNSHCHLYHNRLLKELRRGISPNQLLMLGLLAGLKRSWELDSPGVPFATCPADITCALLKPLLTLGDFSPETTAQTKELVRTVHTWVLYTLGSFTPASYDIIRKSCNLEDDPVIRHREYEDNGLIAPRYLAAYVRSKNIQMHRLMLERIDKNEEAPRGAYEEVEELTMRRASYDQIEEAPGFFTHDDDNEGDENNELFGASFLLEID